MKASNEARRFTVLQRVHQIIVARLRKTVPNGGGADIALGQIGQKPRGLVRGNYPLAGGAFQRGLEIAHVCPYCVTMLCSLITSPAHNQGLRGTGVRSQHSVIRCYYENTCALPARHAIAHGRNEEARDEYGETGI